jgi:acetylornithine deacetylase
MASFGSISDALASIELNEGRFIGLLEKLVGESKYLQNSPPQGLIPREDRASDHVLKALEPFTVENGGPLQVSRIHFVDGRGNVIVKYPGTTDKICSFVGSHLDVVPANPASWERDPFKLTIDGDMLYGRGTTDCLGHVALLTDMMISLAEKKPQLKTSIVVVFIVNEENSSFVGIGVEQLAKEGYLDELKNGPLFWIDAADSQPCIGTAGNLQWRMKVTGKLFHSGLPHLGINSIELAMDAVSYIQQRFFQEFKRLPQEDEYNFKTQSSFKATQISCAEGSLNQLPPECTVEGDVRLAPFYDVVDVRRAVDGYVAEINADPSILEAPHIRGPMSKYTLPHEDRKGIVDFKWLGDGENGVACNLNSTGYAALVEGTKSVLGDARPYAIGGSLPLIRDLQEQGFDVQISGYGISSKYHAENEAASLSGMKLATKIICKVISKLEEAAH